MAYKKDQGRYARMFAFWCLALLLMYGCLGGLVVFLRKVIGESEVWIEAMPLLGDVDVAKVIALVVLVVGGFVTHRLLNRPKAADMLIETEAELRRVTWPRFSETWVGTVAVLVTVMVMLFYLFGVDLVLAYVMPRAMGKS